jgi:hypothetical protein
MMDDLRDYRFYGADMIHPNQVAIDYIWEKFSGAYFSETTRKQIELVGQWQKIRGHRTLNYFNLSPIIQNKITLLEQKIRSFVDFKSND